MQVGFFLLVRFTNECLRNAGQKKLKGYRYAASESTIRLVASRGIGVSRLSCHVPIEHEALEISCSPVFFALARRLVLPAVNAGPSPSVRRLLESVYLTYRINKRAPRESRASAPRVPCRDLAKCPASPEIGLTFGECR